MWLQFTLVTKLRLTVAIVVTATTAAAAAAAGNEGSAYYRKTFQCVYLKKDTLVVFFRFVSVFKRVPALIIYWHFFRSIHHWLHKCTIGLVNIIIYICFVFDTSNQTPISDMSVHLIIKTFCILWSPLSTVSRNIIITRFKYALNTNTKWYIL